MGYGDVHLRCKPEMHRMAMIKGFTMRKIWETGYRVLCRVDENSLESITKRKEELIQKKAEVEGEITMMDKMIENCKKIKEEKKAIEKSRVVEII